MLQFEAPKENSNYIKVIGVGGGGTNAINHMYNMGIEGVDFIVCNTDKKSLDASPVQNKIKIGKDGLGAGNNPEKAKVAAEAAKDEIRQMLSNNTQMLFIAAGMGGGTGTGASPVIAQIAKDIDLYDEKNEKTDDKILVVAIVTLPLAFEGSKRKKQAEEGIKKLKEIVDSIIIVNTDKIRMRGNIPLPKMFPMADDVLLTAAKGIAEIITSNAYVSVDFRDVQSVMEKSGVALMGTGTGYGSGEDRALEAIKMAATSDLLNDCSIKGTKNILLYITTSEEEEYSITMDEYQEIANYLQTETEAEPDIIWGLKYDDSYKDRIDITMIATGFKEQELFMPLDRNAATTKTIPLEEKPEDEPIKTPIPTMEKKEEVHNPNAPIKVTPIEDEKQPEPFVRTIPQQPETQQPIQDTAKVENPLRHELNVYPSAAENKPKEEQKINITEESTENRRLADFTIKHTTQVAQEIETKPQVAVMQDVTKPNVIDEQPADKKVSIEPDFDVRDAASPFSFDNKTQEDFVRERQARMEQWAQKMKNPQSIEDMIKTPAYQQFNLDIRMKEHSKERDTSSFSLENGKLVKDDNSFLNDNPD